MARETKEGTSVADHIRAMSDSELASFLIRFQNTFGEEYEGEQSCLEWLKSDDYLKETV